MQERLSLRRRRRAKEAERLSFAGKVVRLGHRLKDPEWRRYGLTLMAGKFIALAIILFVVLVAVPSIFSHTALAQDTATTQAATQPTTQAAAAAPDPYATAKGGDIINPLNTVWTLVAAFLVFGMQVGFTMLEAGRAVLDAIFKRQDDLNRSLVFRAMPGTVAWFQRHGGVRTLPSGLMVHVPHSRETDRVVLKKPVTHLRPANPIGDQAFTLMSDSDLIAYSATLPKSLSPQQVKEAVKSHLRSLLGDSLIAWTYDPKTHQEELRPFSIDDFVQNYLDFPTT